MSRRMEISKEIEELEIRLGMTARKPEDVLMAQIKKLEAQLQGSEEVVSMGFDEEIAQLEEDMMLPADSMDEEIGEILVDEEFSPPEELIPLASDKAAQDDDDEDGDDDDDEDEDGDEDEDEKEASEERPGIEDRIKQPFESLAEELGVEDIGQFGLETVKDQTTYASRLQEASARLDRVANYFETQGHADLALRIDKISDAVDAGRDEISK